MEHRRIDKPRPRRNRLCRLEWLEPRELCAVNLPAGFQMEHVGSTLFAPTSMDFAPDGRLFVAEQSGNLKVVKDGQLLDQPFWTAPTALQGERGLVGVVVDPGFETNHYVYVFYTAQTTPLRNRVSRLEADGDVARPGSETVLIDLAPIDPSRPPFHNGGSMHFGPDGKLYIGTGDLKRDNSSQSLNDLAGKILRINPDGSIPADNPFVNRATGSNQAIWAMGLRNPFSFAFQPGSGRMFINDVGFRSYEEINVGRPGANYGWPRVEGPSRNARYQAPLFAYAHGEGEARGCAITAGVFAPTATAGGTFPGEFAGQYYFADYCNTTIRRIGPNGGAAATFASSLPPYVIDLNFGPDGALYLLARGTEAANNGIFKIEYLPNQPPSLTQSLVLPLASAGHPVTIAAEVTGAEPITYQWQRDGQDIPGATQRTLVLPGVSLADHGARIRLTATNRFGALVSPESTLQVTATQPPTAAITQPAANARPRIGSSVRFAGVGIDPRLGPLPPSALTWRVDLHHDQHIHPYVQRFSGANGGSFRVISHGDPMSRYWYEIVLTVTSPSGLSTTVNRLVNPRRQ